MNLEVEVFKTDLPAFATFLSCQIEALGSGEVIKDSASLIAGGTTKLPALKFNFSKASTHVALNFTASVQSGEEEVGSCLYPLTFNNRMTRLLGQLIPPDLAEKTHLVYLSMTIPGINIEKMVGKIWFRIRDLNAPRRSYNKAQTSNGNWLDMKCMQQPDQPVPQPNVEELVSREAQALCVAPVPGEEAVVSVLFHSVTMPQISNDTLTIACVGCLLNIKEDSLFNEDENGALQTVPTLKPITLNCGRNDTVLELHVADSYSKHPFFSSSCSLGDLVPFQHYNWEYNWRWAPGVGGSSPEHSQGNLEANVTVSVVYWPSSYEKSQYEGLEVFVKEVECRSQQEKTDVVLTCQLKNSLDSVSGEGTNTPPYRQRENSTGEEEDCNLGATVIKYFSNETEFSGASGYYFFSSDSTFTSTSGHKIVFNLYATSHNSSLWWQTEAKSTATIDLSEALRRALSWPKNASGVRWELFGDAISDTSSNTLTVRKLSGILRWKKTTAEFLGLGAISQFHELPLLSEVSETELGRFFSDSPGGRKSGCDHDAVWKGAVAKMGRDILMLREENDVLKRENREYEKFVVEMESSIVVTAAKEKALLPLTKNDLIHKIVELSERLTTEIETRKMFQDKVHKLQNFLIKKNDVEACYTDLQEAHKSQQKLIRELQAKIPKYKKCWETCKQQELVIKQLLAHEASIAGNAPNAGENSEVTDVATKPADADAGDEGSEIEDRASDTQGEKSLKSFREELSIARKRFLELEEKVTHLSENKRSSHLERDKVAGLESQLEVAAAKERAVMEELRNNAVKWAKEKSRYELEIARMQRHSSRSHQHQPPTTSEVSTRIRNSDSTTTGNVPSSNTVSTSPRQQGSSVMLRATSHSSASVRSVPTPVPTAQHRSSTLAAVSNASHPLQNSVKSEAISNH